MVLMLSQRRTITSGEYISVSRGREGRREGGREGKKERRWGRRSPAFSASHSTDRLFTFAAPGGTHYTHTGPSPEPRRHSRQTSPPLPFLVRLCEKRPRCASASVKMIPAAEDSGFSVPAAKSSRPSTVNLLHLPCSGLTACSCRK